MLAAFCLRLSLGLVAFLPLLPADKMHPRFFRTQFLTALGLSIVALAFGYQSEATLLTILIAGVIASFAGALIWTLEPPPLGGAIGWIATVLFAAGAALVTTRDPSWFWANAITSGLLLGGTVTAMLVGHSYLISPGLTIRPLMNMLYVCGLCLLARMVVLTITTGPLIFNEYEVPISSDHWLWFVPRCLIGLGGPLVFGLLAYRTARINSTQSATGILYVVVICTFIGELFGILIERTAHLPA